MSTRVIRVMYHPEWRSWGVTTYDAQDNVLGESNWFHKKSDAMMDAKQALAYGDVAKVKVYDRLNNHLRTLTVKDV